MSIRSLSIAAALVTALAASAAVELVGSTAPPRVAAVRQPLPLVTVYKSPSCGCCTAWVERLQSAGFTVKVNNLDDVDQIKNAMGIPAAARSCHTAVVGGYTIEGHVPPAAIIRLLRDKPRIAGLAVPGMPAGAPGMEVPGQRAAPYAVVAIGRDGTLRTWARY